MFTVLALIVAWPPTSEIDATASTIDRVTTGFSSSLIVTFKELLAALVFTLAPVADARVTEKFSTLSFSVSFTAVKTILPEGFPAGIVKIPAPERLEVKSAPAPVKETPLEFKSANVISTLVLESEIAEENSTIYNLVSLFLPLCHNPSLCNQAPFLFGCSFFCQSSLHTSKSEPIRFFQPQTLDESSYS